MVIAVWPLARWLRGCLAPLLAEQERQPLLSRLDPKTRLSVILALVGLVLLGGTLVLLTRMGGRFVRSSLKKPLPPARPQGEDWAKKPLNAPREEEEVE